MGGTYGTGRAAQRWREPPRGLGEREAMAEQKIGLITHYFGKIGVAA